ncbi:hypothetical protein ND00_18590 [Clostridium sp. L74]|nr:hypothetical protein ND00_18590 [Clostridium sp. L74]
MTFWDTFILFRAPINSLTFVVEIIMLANNAHGNIIFTNCENVTIIRANVAHIYTIVV